MHLVCIGTIVLRYVQGLAKIIFFIHNIWQTLIRDVE